jgi:hypothetical protein
LLSPTTDIAVSDNVTFIRGKHSMKTGLVVIRNRKDQNGRSGYTVTSPSIRSPRAVDRQLFADALLGKFPQLTAKQRRSNRFLPVQSDRGVCYRQLEGGAHSELLSSALVSITLVQPTRRRIT